MKKYLSSGLIIFLSIITVITACDNDSDKKIIVSSRSYSGHESDVDGNNFAQTYPATVGKRLDNCQTCHTGGKVVYTDGYEKTIDNPCDYCHVKVFENSADFTSGYPATYYSTLNSYGKAYYDEGRSKTALKTIENLDSDDDGYTNIAEINDSRFPGDADSNPGLPLASTKEVTWTEIQSMTYHEQFMLLNATKQQYDEYVTLGGVKISDFFDSLGIDVEGATGFTIFAPDGYSKSFYFTDGILEKYPDGIFYDIRTIQDTWDTDRKFVNYPDIIPNDLVDKSAISNLFMIIAFKRNGVNLDTSYYDSTDGKISGEGPFRIIRPQNSNANIGDNPYGPDRGSKSNTYSDDWNYVSAADHNAGDAVKGTCVIRIDPMPSGYEEYDWKNGWHLIVDKKIVIYGHGVTDK